MNDEVSAGSPRTFESRRIAVTARGRGPDVVLIPGLGSSPEVWEAAICALPGMRYHLVQVAGFAGWPAGDNAAGPVVEPVAAEIARYLAEAKLDRPALVGHSLGGSCALIVAARHPGLVSRVMVVDVLPFVGAAYGGGFATAGSARPLALEMRATIIGSSGEQRRAMAERTMAGLVRDGNRRPLAVHHALDSDPRVSGQALYDLMTLDLRPELANIDVPLTVLWVRPPRGAASRAQLERSLKLAYRGARHARLVRIDDSYHFIMWDAPEAFLRELERFLTSPASGVDRRKG